MKEEIAKLLNDDNFNNLENVDAKVDAITSALGINLIVLIMSTKI